MKSFFTILVISCFALSFTFYHEIKPTQYIIDNTSSVTIKGTSNLHDWIADVNDLSGNANFTFSNNRLINIRNCKISFDPKSIKSKRGATMDKNIYKALNVDTYSTIDYHMKSIQAIKNTRDGFTATMEGDLTVAGITKNISVDFSGKKMSNGKFEISGSKDMKMSTFNVKPPSALMGALQTDDNITIEFRFSLNR